MGDVTSDGYRLIKNYLSAKDRLQRARNELANAETEAKACEKELADWLSPSDIKEGEKIGVWHGDSIFQVEQLPVGQRKVTVRTRGKRFEEMKL